MSTCIERSRAFPFLLPLSFLLFWATPSRASDSLKTPQAEERWVATSTTAISVTGDVSFSPKRIKFINGATLTIAATDTTVTVTDSGESVRALVYRVAPPRDVVLKNGNHLCGSSGRSSAVTFILVWKPILLPGDRAARAFSAFSGDAVPRSIEDASTCGVYYYELR